VPGDPLRELESWIEDARSGGLAHPAAAAFVTASADGRPSARMVTLKRLEPDALLFTTALWTRKARELGANPYVSLLWHWPALGRQVHVSGEGSFAERTLAHLLFAERDLDHRLQTVISRQGEPIGGLAPLRARMARLQQELPGPPQCPAEWGAVRVRPEAIEFWVEAKDRLHERRLYERDGHAWRMTRLAP
jgi:pyridoxamine 5'-phosphate oxidase